MTMIITNDARNMWIAPAISAIELGHRRCAFFFFVVHWLMSAHFYHVLFIIIGMFTNCYWMLNYELACCCCFECAAFRKFAATCNSVALVCVCICVVVAICTNGHGTKPEFSFTFYWVFSVAAASATTACINNGDNDTTTTTMATINPWFLMCIIVVLQQQLIFSVFFFVLFKMHGASDEHKTTHVMIIAVHCFIVGRVQAQTRRTLRLFVRRMRMCTLRTECTNKSESIVTVANEEKLCYIYK